MGAFDKKGAMTWLKGYLKAIKEHLEKEVAPLPPSLLSLLSSCPSLFPKPALAPVAVRFPAAPHRGSEHHCAAHGRTGTHMISDQSTPSTHVITHACAEPRALGSVPGKVAEVGQGGDHRPRGPLSSSFSPCSFLPFSFPRLYGPAFCVLCSSVVRCLPDAVRRTVQELGVTVPGLVLR
eukprot:2669997-Rhodomonas_salina.2